MKFSKGLQGRWLRNTLSILVVLVLVSAAALSITIAAYYYSNVRSSLVTRAVSDKRLLEGQETTELEQICITYTEQYRAQDVLALQFLTPGGKVLASSNGEFTKKVRTEDVEQAYETEELASFCGTDGQFDTRVMSVTVPVLDKEGEIVGLLRYAAGLERIDRQLLLFSVMTLLMGILILATVYLSGSYYVRSVVEPISEITKTAKRIAGGSYGVQIKHQFDDEIGELAETINDMSTKISQNEKMQSEFVSSVSHELRTPLTAIGGWSETLLSAGGSVESTDAKRGLGIILQETKRLTGMVEELLEFTRMQDGRFTLNISQACIRPDFEDTVFMYSNRLSGEKIDLQYLDNDDDIPDIPCDLLRLRQVYLNLLDNAAKHGAEGGKITAELCRDEKDIIIRIRDFGPGIPPEELPLVKKKFYKGSSKARGSGIGLAVCDEIVRMHNGTLTLSNAEGGGLLVTIRLHIGEQ